VALDENHVRQFSGAVVPSGSFKGRFEPDAPRVAWINQAVTEKAAEIF
jgi:hypothetical protein